MSEPDTTWTERQSAAVQKVHDTLQFHHEHEAALRTADPVIRGDRLEEPARHQARIMAADPDERFQVISDCLEETYGPRAGVGNLAGGGSDFPNCTASKLYHLGFSDAQVHTVVRASLDQDGWVDSTGLAAALAELVDAPGSDLVYQQSPAAIAYRHERGDFDTDTAGTDHSTAYDSDGVN